MQVASYRKLLLEAQPEAIETEKQYETTSRRVGELIRRGRNRTAEETKLLRLLAVLIQEYDRRHAAEPSGDTPAERLQYLLDESGKTPADLLPIFGQRSHVNEALNGKRPFSATHARKLGELFRLNPGYFL